MAGLDRERIVATCLALADAKGLSSLSMRRVSAELGVTPMAIYHHVRSKDELLDMVADESLRALPDLAAGAGVRPALSDWACAFYALLVEHPGLAQVVAARRLEGPVAAQAAAQLLAGLAAEGVDDERAVELLVAIVSLVLGGALYRTSRSAAAVHRGDRRIPKLDGAAGRLRERVAAATLDDEQFRSMVDRLLDGYLA
ncbi:MAG TPA: TetR family transcriptional regulator [Nocardioides sp.]|nr:TetR family transcriptional regulator [Nocardioides sp.]